MTTSTEANAISPISLRESGKSTISSEEVPRKAAVPIVSIPSESLTESSEIHSSKIYSPVVLSFVPSAYSADISALQLEKTRSPICSTLAGIFTDSNAPHLLNALSPIDIIPSDILTCLRVLCPENALALIPLTV